MAALAVASVAAGGRVRAEIAVGPFSFHEWAFADAARQLEPGTVGFRGTATSLEEAITGYSPGKGIFGSGPLESRAQLFQLDFLDARAINSPGHDLVFFTAVFAFREAADSFGLAVREAGGDFTDFRAFPASKFVDTGVAGPTVPFDRSLSCRGFCREKTRLFALTVDLDDFGLPAGAEVDALRFRWLAPGVPFRWLAPAAPIMAATSHARATEGAPTAVAPDRGRTAREPNVLFIVLDDAGYGDFGVQQRAGVRTPAIDRLAAAGMVFTQHYANGPVCSPTRAAILSGRYPSAFGIQRGVTKKSMRGLPPEIVTLPELLKEHGYATAHIGKWHLGEKRPESLPAGQGFDHSVMRTRSVLKREGKGYFDPAVLIDGSRVVQHEGHLTRVLTDYAIEFVRNHRDRRFFLNLWYKAPHVPIEPPRAWADRYPDTPEGRYAALLGHADEQIGRLLESLDRLGIAERTLVVLTSDNGAVDPKSNGGLRGMKAGLFEGGIRVPLIVRWPDVVPPGTRNDSVTASFDLLPTVAAILGADVSNLGLHGESFLEVLERNALRKREKPLIWQSTEFIRAVSIPRGNLYSYAVRRGRWKLLRASAGTYLFDLDADPLEVVNLQESHPAVEEELRAAYRSWRLSVPRIDYRVESALGSAKTGPAGWTFGGWGTVSLAPNALFDFHDGDFSLTGIVTLDRDAESEPRECVIARKRGSWALRLTADSRAELVVEGGDGRRSVLRSEAKVNPGEATALAFTVQGLRDGNSIVKLYLGGRLEDASMELPAVRSSESSIAFGGAKGEGGGPFRGTIRDLHLYASSLSEAELAALHAAASAPPR